jgi:hypothetical protein
MTAHRLLNNNIIVQIVVKVFYILCRCLPTKLPLNLLNRDFDCSVFLLIVIQLLNYNYNCMAQHIFDSAWTKQQTNTASLNSKITQNGINKHSLWIINSILFIIYRNFKLHELKEVAAEREFLQVSRFLSVSIITKLVNTHLQLNVTLIRRTRGARFKHWNNEVFFRITGNIKQSRNFTLFNLQNTERASMPYLFCQTELSSLTKSFVLLSCVLFTSLVQPLKRNESKVFLFVSLNVWLHWWLRVNFANALLSSLRPFSSDALFLSFMRASRT